MFGKPTKTTQVIRWTARILSLFSTGLLLLFVFNEPFPVSRLTVGEWLGFALFPVGIVVGFVVAWWKEGFGGAITLGSLLAFYVVFVFLLNGNLKQGLGFLVFSLPGFLFVISWLISQSRQTFSSTI